MAFGNGARKRRGRNGRRFFSAASVVSASIGALALAAAAVLLLGLPGGADGFAPPPLSLASVSSLGSRRRSYGGGFVSAPVGVGLSASLSSSVGGKAGHASDDDELQEQGYGDVLGGKKSSPFGVRRILRGAARLGRKVLLPRFGTTAGASSSTEPGTLILVRHGESLWNANKTFTGWADPDLSPQGYREVEHAARLLLEGGFEIDVVFTSRLKRAIRSAALLLQELNEVYLPVFKSWRLNERMYGALTGLSKAETAEKLGHELVQAWRGSLRSRPPPVRRSDQYWPGRDRRYGDLSSEQIPLTESLLDCMGRTAPLWEDKIRGELALGRSVLVVAHANTLRGLVKIIDEIGDDEIQDVAIPTGIPIIYKFDRSMKPVPPSGDRQTASQVHMNGLFLEKPGLLKEALKREEEWSTQVPGYDDTMARYTRVSSTSRERSLYKLNAIRELGEWAGKFVDEEADAAEDDGNDGKGNFIHHGSGGSVAEEDEVWEEGLHRLEEGLQFDPDFPEFHLDKSSATGANGLELEAVGDSPLKPAAVLRSPSSVAAVPAAAIAPGIGEVPIRRDPYIVIIRHGKTEHNKLGLFTGWEDAPLADEGVDEAKEAGRLLRMHGFEFDVCYTSWLSRAIDTAWLVMDELDCWWCPTIKVRPSQRILERAYLFLVQSPHGV